MKVRAVEAGAQEGAGIEVLIWAQRAKSREVIAPRGVRDVWDAHLWVATLSRVGPGRREEHDGTASNHAPSDGNHDKVGTAHLCRGQRDQLEYILGT